MFYMLRLQELLMREEYSMENMKTNKISDKDLKKVSSRWILGSQITWNYEKMMAPGYHYSILPILRKLYSEDDLKTMMKNHMQFFNTTPHMGGFILGMDIAMEEEEGIKGADAVQGLKTGLMGPFAGIGDTLFGVLIDRKSTRLNSSHVSISYAVFCLKKKKKIKIDVNLQYSV